MQTLFNCTLIHLADTTTILVELAVLAGRWRWCIYMPNTKMPKYVFFAI